MRADDARGEPERHLDRLELTAEPAPCHHPRFRPSRLKPTTRRRRDTETLAPVSPESATRAAEALKTTVPGG